jgi:hypothetical protein
VLLLLLLLLLLLPPPQAVQSRRDDDTSSPGRHRAPVWNQEFQFLVEDLANQVNAWVGEVGRMV